MKKQMKKLLAVGLALCLILSAVPVSAATVEQSGGEIAAEQNGAVSAAPATPAVPEAVEEVAVIREEESLRGEYEKHFLMSDGSYQVEVYAYPVHELVDGVWVELAEPGQNARGEVSPGSAQTNILDNFVWEGHGVQSSTGLRLYIGSRSGYTARTYIQFATMPTIPAGATITAATMKLTMVSGTSLAYTANAYQVTGGEWDPTTIQWTNKPAADVLLESNISNNDRTKYQFSVLTAVQHWYDGDPTGQNENYGIMLRYYDETLTGYYNSVYSGDVVDTNSRPKLTITYDVNKINIREGETYTLSASRAVGSVNWTSSDTSVATVNSNGVVTGIKAGKVTIKEFVDNTEQKAITVYVAVADGVYRLRSNMGLYLGTYGGVAENTSVKLLAYSNNDLDKIRQIWKVTYLGDGYYSIRPLHKANMGLHAGGYTGSSVDIVNIGSNDTLSAVALINRWGIGVSADGDAYYLNHVGTQSLGLKMDGYVPSVGMNVTIAQNPGTDAFEWRLEAVENLDPRLLLYDMKTNVLSSDIERKVYVNETYSLNDLCVDAYAVSIDGSNQEITWESLNPQVASVNASTGEIVGHVPGQSAIIRGTIEGNAEYCTGTYRVLVCQSVQTVFYAIPDEGHDHESKLLAAKDELASVKLTQTIIKNTGVSATLCKEDLKSAEIFTSRSHGLQVPLEGEDADATGIVVTNSVYFDYQSIFFSNPLEVMNPNWTAIESTDDFSNLDIAVFVGCYTAAGGAGGNNLPTRIVECGCKVAIGFTGEIDCQGANTWVDVFYKKLADGKSVADAASDATTAAGTSTNGISEDTVVVVGDSGLTLENLMGQ